ncbi:hypothetical protein E1B28_003583 [Marasmius oreades]|uniref:Uncharacterized protein n=1 Tax=Marasmius oreades TaxID=181124 RepID=A0A9P7RMU3_9AGAR|nr:uncharacterized protein E1B28_003583 [Marasmius oreades]KAG7086063.1 hypothetical protein E1B28_003583 [Marasmius oreades]
MNPLVLDLYLSFFRRVANILNHWRGSRRSGRLPDLGRAAWFWMGDLSGLVLKGCPVWEKEIQGGFLRGDYGGDGERLMSRVVNTSFGFNAIIENVDLHRARLVTRPGRLRGRKQLSPLPLSFPARFGAIGFVVVAA